MAWADNPVVYSGNTATWGDGRVYDYGPVGPGGTYAWQLRTQPLTPAAQSTVSGVDTTALESALFGKDIPKFVGGQALIGCRIIEGPFLHDNKVDFIATAAQSANPSATRTITSLRLNGTESWTASGGPIGTPFAGMTV